MNTSDIFLKAAEFIGNDTYYMCIAIGLALGDVECPIPKEIIEAGFTYDNYEKFICKNYPHLEDYLLKQNDYINAWIMMTKSNGIIFKILDSKIKFLKYLANGQ